MIQSMVIFYIDCVVYDTLGFVNCRYFAQEVLRLKTKKSLNPIAKFPEVPSSKTELTVIKTDLQTGEVLFEKTVRGSRSGSGWIMMFTDKGMELVANCDSPITLRVFLYLSMGQTYAGGMVTTKLDVEQKLGISHAACARAFKWLKANFIIHEWRVRGCTEFMVSPVYVSVGRFDERVKLWNARWEVMPFYASAQYQRKKSIELTAKLKDGVVGETAS